LRKAFTLIELLVVVAIVGILASVMVPAIIGGHTISQTSVCKNNQRQLVLAVAAYQTDHGANPPSVVSMFTHWDDDSILWQYIGGEKENTACPNHSNSEYSVTGYNYNTSFIGDEFIVGSGLTVKGLLPAECSHPSHCALFGDGYKNKFMRSTLSDASIRCGGRQEYRHNFSTVVGWLDGHVSSQEKKFNNNCTDEQQVGFLSEDNSAYDPRKLVLQ
jgi:prepilin-type N-terminal cleavage/methylation domain-containing protein/prepilin-type processing-associated H-X9-DG protein